MLRGLANSAHSIILATTTLGSGSLGRSILHFLEKFSRKLTLGNSYVPLETECGRGINMKSVMPQSSLSSFLYLLVQKMFIGTY